MAGAPKLDSVSFPKLCLDPQQSNTGTVTGTNIKIGDSVQITGDKTKGVWDGTVDSAVVAGAIWNATVRAVAQQGKKEIEHVIDMISVTVTNGVGTSNPVIAKSDIVP